MSISNIKLSDIASPLGVYSWENYPGLLIGVQTSARLEKKESSFKKSNPTFGATIFKKFITDKIPRAKDLYLNLITKYNIREFHFPLPLRTILFIFMDELIEHYQNQIEQRDEKLDEDYVNFKSSIAPSPTQIWADDKEEINRFLSLLKEKLALVDALPDDFVETIAIWSEILNIQYVANMTFLEINLPMNYAPIHQLPKSKESSFIKSLITTELSRGQILKAYCLIIDQISKDSTWVIPKMLKGFPPLSNKQLEEDFAKITMMQDPQKKGATVFSQIQNYTNEIQNIVNQLHSINLSDSKAVIQLKNRINSSQRIAFSSSINLEDLLSELKNNVKKEIYRIEGVEIDTNHPLSKHLSNYTVCVRLNNSYLSSPFKSLFFILDSIISSNEIWNKFQTEGIVPNLTSSSLINKYCDEDAEKSAKDLLAKLENEKSCFTAQKKTNGKKQKGKVFNNSNKTPGASFSPAPVANVIEPKESQKLANGNESVQTSSTTTTMVTFPDITTNTSPVLFQSSSQTLDLASLAPLKQIDILREKLLTLYNHNPARPLRQVIWHLDHLIVMQDSFANRLGMTRTEDLCLLSAVSNYAQKILEQTYRFCLKQENSSFTTTHNLKGYNRQLDPKLKTHPDIINKLYLANHWHRYFYSEHKKWSSFTTFAVKAPLVLDKLYKIASGQPYSSEELNQTIEGIIKNSCQHVETLLNQKSAATENLRSQYAKVQLNNAISEKTFAEIQQKLESFLAQAKDRPATTSHPDVPITDLHADHLVFLNIKQALAALSILSLSLQKMNKANDIREFTTWTTWSLLQLQESIENLLHSIEYYQKGKISIKHELKTLSEQLGLEMGSLATEMQELSYKVRYPNETENTNLSTQIIDDLEALKEHPDLEMGYKLQNISKMLWTSPSPHISFKNIVANINRLIVEAEQFLNKSVMPALQAAYDVRNS